MQCKTLLSPDTTVLCGETRWLGAGLPLSTRDRARWMHVGLYSQPQKKKKKKTTARHTKRLKSPGSFTEHLKKVCKNMKEHNTKFKIYHIGEKSQFCLYQNHLTYNNFSSIEDKLENIGNQYIKVQYQTRKYEPQNQLYNWKCDFFSW